MSLCLQRPPEHARNYLPRHELEDLGDSPMGERCQCGHPWFSHCRLPDGACLACISKEERL